jgi:hypothetical protein
MFYIMVFDVDMFRALSGATGCGHIDSALVVDKLLKRCGGAGGVVGPPMVRNWLTKGNVSFLGQFYDPGAIMGSMGRSDVFSFRT